MNPNINMTFGVETWEFNYIEQTNRFFIDGLILIGFPFNEGIIVQFCEGDTETPLRTMLCRIRKISGQLFPGDTSLVFYLDQIDARFSPVTGQHPKGEQLS